MDPDANLEEQLRLTERILDEECTDNASVRARADAAERLAELVQALDGWITGGGFLPARWRRDTKGA